jgi:hypothetical protein
MVLTGSGCEEKVGAALVGSDPRAIHAHFCGGLVYVSETSCAAARAVWALSQIFDHIELCRLEVGRVSGAHFNFEFDVLGAARGLGGGDGDLTLRGGLAKANVAQRITTRATFMASLPLGLRCWSGPVRRFSADGPKSPARAQAN